MHINYSFVLRASIKRLFPCENYCAQITLWMKFPSSTRATSN